MTAIVSNSDLDRLYDLARRWRGQDRRLAAAADDLDALLSEIASRRADGGDLLCAEVSGNSVPDLQALALLKAADLWGLDAITAVEKTGIVHETLFTNRGRYHASVYVRCLNYGEIAK